MSRPHRNAYPGGYFHVGTRGNNKQAIYIDGVDRYWFLEMFGKATVRYEWSIYAYCLMTNHYHAVLCIPEGGLSEGMCELNGGFARWSNFRHGRVDHLFGRRFSSREIKTEEYLLEACRYVVLNPVRAGLVRRPEAGVGAATVRAPASTIRGSGSRRPRSSACSRRARKRRESSTAAS
jgi:putative transposase